MSTRINLSPQLRRRKRTPSVCVSTRRLGLDVNSLLSVCLLSLCAHRCVSACVACVFIVCMFESLKKRNCLPARKCVLAYWDGWDCKLIYVCVCAECAFVCVFTKRRLCRTAPQSHLSMPQFFFSPPPKRIPLAGLHRLPLSSCEAKTTDRALMTGCSTKPKSRSLRISRWDMSQHTRWDKGGFSLFTVLCWSARSSQVWP